jgi:hypothetical protein
VEHGSRRETNLWFSIVFAVVLIAAIASMAAAQRFDCEDTFFDVGRNEESCSDFFVCMLNRRLDFFCDEGTIFDEEQIECRPGNAETCEFDPTTTNAPAIDSIPAHSKQVEIVGDECEFEFLLLAPHPDATRCAEFFMCLNYNLIRFECDPGFIFSEEARDCIRGSHETCEADGGTPFSKVMKLMKRLKKN